MAGEEPTDRSVADSVREYLKDLGDRDEALARSPLATSALALAREMDGQNSATSKSMCAKALNETLAQLRALAPEETGKDDLDELAERRKQRRAGKARAAG
jgi:hypothetical protein